MGLPMVPCTSWKFMTHAIRSCKNSDPLANDFEVKIQDIVLIFKLEFFYTSSLLNWLVTLSLHFLNSVYNLKKKSNESFLSKAFFRNPYAESTGSEIFWWRASYTFLRMHRHLTAVFTNNIFSCASFVQIFLDKTFISKERESRWNCSSEQQRHLLDFWLHLNFFNTSVFNTFYS